jgi:hypothetical protein
MANSRITTTVTANRKYDIDFVNWSGTGAVEGVASFTFGDLSKKTTGIVKAANKFLNILLSYKGSDPYNLNRGTYFEEVSTRGGDSLNDLGSFIASQVSDAYAQIRDIQSKNTFPSDENIIAVTLVAVDAPSADLLKIQIKIQVESGESTSVIVPILGG